MKKKRSKTLRIENKPLIIISVIVGFFTLLFPSQATFVFSGLLLFLWFLFFILLDSSKKIAITRKLENTHLFLNEDVTVTTTIKNNSHFPVFLMRMEDRSNMEGAIFASLAKLGFIALNPGEKLILTHKIRFSLRGIYVLKNIFVSFYDPFRLSQIVRFIHDPVEVVVYPEKVLIETFPALLRELLPALQTPYRLLEDLNHTDSIREYSPFDSVRRIHWKASAHTGSLMVKTFNHTATARVRLFLDLNLSREIIAQNVWKGIRAKYEEKAVSTIAAFVEYLMGKGLPPSLYIAGDENEVQVIENFEYADTMKLLSGIHGSDSPRFSFQQALESQFYSLNLTSTVFIVSMYLTQSTLPLLLKIKSRVSRLVVLLMPFGFNMDPAETIYPHTHEKMPAEIEKLEQTALTLRSENIIVHLIKPYETLNEIMNGISH